MSGAAKIMRAVADHSYVMGDRIVTPCADLPEGDVDEAMQTAARVLDALAVIGPDQLATYAAIEPEGPTRAALRTLADAAKGE